MLCYMHIDNFYTIGVFIIYEIAVSFIVRSISWN